MIRRLYFFIFFIFLMSACSVTKHLPEGKLLYEGADLELEPLTDFEPASSLSYEIESVLSPIPNSSFLGMKVKLWFYYVAGTPKGKGLRYWIKNKLGEKPVIYDPDYTESVKNLIKNRLENNGHFRASVSFEEEVKNKKITIHYKAEIYPPYCINTVHFPEDSSILSKEIQTLQSSTLLEKGKPYSLEALKQERNRIDFELKQRGYYFFGPDYLIYEIDTTAGKPDLPVIPSLDSIFIRDNSRFENQLVDIFLLVKSDTPKKATLPQKVENIFIYPNYQLDKDSNNNTDTLRLEEFEVISRKSRFKPGLFRRSIFLEKNKKYNRTDHQITLQRFSDLDAFKFVNIKFTKDSTQAEDLLNASIYLTPRLKRSIKAEIAAISRSDGFGGSELKIQAINRNLFGAGENLNLSLSGNYLGQFGSRRTINSLIELKLSAEIDFPYLFLPFNLNKAYNQFTFHTLTNLSYQYLVINPGLRANTLELKLGYEWRESIAKKHSLYPLSLTFQNTTVTSTQISNDIGQNFIAQSLEDQFLLGANYKYTYNDLLNGEKQNNFYFSGSVETAGNLLSLIQDIRKNPDNPRKLLGARYAQFARFGVEFRYYRRLSKSTQLASRFLANLGIPYGNSDILPFFKQYFIGGPNSIRAFPLRSLGPGSYSPPDSLQASNFVQRAGDIKLEANVEYRFGIFSFLNGAVFLDTGNIWLLKNDSTRVGGKFETQNFLKEIAIGTGVGLRFDFSFLVLRFDFGFPLYNPILPDRERWIINKINFFSKDWRRDNLTFNVAIGYPF